MDKWIPALWSLLFGAYLNSIYSGIKWNECVNDESIIFNICLCNLSAHRRTIIVTASLGEVLAESSFSSIVFY